MSLERVLTWRQALRTLTPDLPDLSPAGARFALDAALDAWDDLPRHVDRPVPAHTVVVPASTVFTAPLEWAAVLLARGGKVTIKAPRALEAWFAQVARSTDLPLVSTVDRAVLMSADRVVLMGSDATLAGLQTGLGERLLGFGHRFSVAWWEDPAHAEDLALDLALYDGRGCMSPVAVFSPIPDAAARLADAMAALEVRLPRGRLTPAEGASVRERTALARVLGRATVGPAWAVLELPVERFTPAGLPRVATVHTASFPAFLAAIEPFAPSLSVLGTDRPTGLTVRECALGRMQLPPLDRLHDGVDWLRAIEHPPAW